jgi:hypothetical protein
MRIEGEPPPQRKDIQSSTSTSAPVSAVPDPRAPWRIRLSDLDTGNVLYETMILAT